ncbi:PID-CTERM protein-sorting domain-containing protein [Yeosuana marina]|uniref:PID-CTERM protein-sorting domain-containing protein n=1 Tax=Yeosuana marina TaxID=1565536 RepID=UPI00142384E1|nr:hypothetical protein [Yeosuana marina]
MKINKTFLKTIRAILILLALTFSTNTNATTFGGNKPKREKHNDWKPKKPKKVEREHKRERQREGECETPSVPLDGGLSILLIGAAAFGVKKLRGSKNDEI